LWNRARFERSSPAKEYAAGATTRQLEAYRAVVAPIETYRYGNDGKQPGDPQKAALAMIEIVEGSPTTVDSWPGRYRRLG